MEFFSKLSVKEKKGLYIAVLIISIAAFDRLIISPIASSFRKLNHDIKTDEKRLVLGLRNLNQKDAVLAEYQKYEKNIRKTESDEEEVSKTLDEIEGLARKAHVSMIDVKTRSPQQVDFYTEYTMDLEIQGDPESIANFLYQINTSPLLLRTTRVRFGSQEKDSKGVKASIVVTRILL